MPTAATVVHYEALEECILSGQVADAEVPLLLRQEPEFAAWFKARMPSRQRGCVTPAY